jgi:pyroglutamyl-peptidase
VTGRLALRVLLTGFEPFGGEPVNPSQMLVEELGSAAPPEGVELHTAVLPVDIHSVRDALLRAVESAAPDVVLLVGQATARPAVCLEARAHNQVAYGDAVDNGGTRIDDEAVVPDGPPELHATLPLDELAAALAGEDLPVVVSHDAGRYLCNLVLYETLHRHPGLPAAFVHLPLLPSQAERRGLGEPSVSADVSRRCLQRLIARLGADRPGVA